MKPGAGRTPQRGLQSRSLQSQLLCLFLLRIWNCTSLMTLSKGEEATTQAMINLGGWGGAGLNCFTQLVNHCPWPLLEYVVRILSADVHFLTWKDLRSLSRGPSSLVSDMKGQQSCASPKATSQGGLCPGPCSLPLSCSLSLLSIPSLSTYISLLHWFSPQESLLKLPLR